MKIIFAGKSLHPVSDIFVQEINIPKCFQLELLHLSNDLINFAAHF